jgi:type VI secretion system protein ImpI
VRYGLVVRVTDTTDNSVVEHTFAKLPVRIGRSSLNDLTIERPFVSEFHAVLGRREGRLVVRDLGSTNGTLLRGAGRVAAGELVDLGEHGNGFAIVSLVFDARLVELEEAPRSQVQPLAVSTLCSSRRTADAARSRPAATAAHAQQYAAYRAAWHALFQSLELGISDMPDAARADAIRELADAMPALSRESDFRKLASSVGVDLGGDSQTTREEFVALQGLKELAGAHVKNRGVPEGVDEIVQFLNKLKGLLDVFFKSFIPLRDGHRQFELDMDLQCGSAHQGAVDSARTPEELAASLLDWTRDDEGEAADIEGTFANVMIHQVALLGGVMNGVKQLLEELSPKVIEARLDDPSKRKQAMLAVGPFRFRALWRLYAQRHGDLAAEERQVFALLFGRRFAEAYHRFHGERVVQAPTKVPESR